MKPRRRFAEHHSYAYQQARKRLLGLPCWRCGQPATSADHCPPLAEWYHPKQTEPWAGELRPSCSPCQRIDGGWHLVNRLQRGNPPPPTQSPHWK